MKIIKNIGKAKYYGKTLNKTRKNIIHILSRVNIYYFTMIISKNRFFICLDSYPNSC